MPSMSFGPRPASRIALSAASACRPICDNSGMRPISVVSAAPMMAIDFGFIALLLSPLCLRRTEQGQGDLVVDLFPGDLDRHVEDDGLRGLPAICDVGHHSPSLVELDHRDCVGPREARHRLVGQAQLRRGRGAFWQSLHGTLVDILWGDAQWMSRFDGWERPTTPIKQSDHILEDWGELCSARKKADDDISRWAVKVDNAWRD